MNTAITAALMDEDDSFGEEWTEETERRPKRARVPYLSLLFAVY